VVLQCQLDLAWMGRLGLEVRISSALIPVLVLIRYYLILLILPSHSGICVFPQNLQVPLTLGKIKPLADALLKHGCNTCGSVPVHFVDEDSNDPSEGILTFNYVGSPYCVETCISAVG
jgi:hypothetical protein